MYLKSRINILFPIKGVIKRRAQYTSKNQDKEQQGTTDKDTSKFWMYSHSDQ